MQEDQLLEKLRAHLESIVPSRFGLAQAVNVKLTRCAGGLHNINYLAEFGDAVPQKIIVRLHPNNKPGFDKTAEEATNMRLLENAPVPKVLWTDKPSFLGSTIIFMEFMPGIHKNLNSLSAQEIGRLAFAISKIHQIRSDAFSPAWGAPPTAHGDYGSYIQAVKESTITERLNSIDPETYHDSAELIKEALIRIDAEIEEADFSNKKFSLLHTDIGEGNILWHEGMPTIIDWEEVTFGDPADEVAYIFAINNLSVDKQREFLNKYLAHSHDAGLALRLPAYLTKNRLFDLVWSINKLHNLKLSPQKDSQQESAKMYKEFYAIRRAAMQNHLRQTLSH